MRSEQWQDRRSPEQVVVLPQLHRQEVGEVERLGQHGGGRHATADKHAAGGHGGEGTESGRRERGSRCIRESTGGGVRESAGGGISESAGGGVGESSGRHWRRRQEIGSARIALIPCKT